MEAFFHSVKLDWERCVGCTNCVKRCPTDAIRVQDGKARILRELCIDCGQCIYICPHHAKSAVVDQLEQAHRFRYTIALPDPSLYGQFHQIRAFPHASVRPLLGTETALVFPILEVLGGEDLHLLPDGEHHHPMLVRRVPEDFRVAEVRLVGSQDGVLVVFDECLSVVEAIRQALRLATAPRCRFRRGVESYYGSRAEARRILMVNDARAAEDGAPGVGQDGVALKIPVD